VKDIFGAYVLRADGVVLQQPTTATGAQTPVLDANTAQPLTGVVAVDDSSDGIASSAAVGCAARSDGTAWCWRVGAAGNSAGRLGNGTTDTSGATFRATQVLTAANTPLTNVRTIARESQCAITNDGEIYCWGDLTYLVNNGTSLISGYAQAITTDGATPLTGVQQLSVGAAAACALVKNASVNEVWCWGLNASRQLGTGDATNRKYPTKILGLTNPTQVVVTRSWQGGGSDQDGVCAVDGDNVLCWGPNYEGQAGTGDATNPVTVPTKVKLMGAVTPLSGITRIYPGHGRVCALHTGNTVWCWGNGYQGYADNIGLANVLNIGFPGGANYTDTAEPFTYLTSDGVYHYNTVAITPKCGSLQ
jgi:alpha-tubulin suppressor-like RCC1 family protein